MKPVLAALLLAVSAVAVESVPAAAESSYWEQRWRSRDATPEYGRAETRRDRAKRADRYEKRRVVRRRYVERDARAEDVVPNPFRVERHDGKAWPTMNNDYWLQSSIYDFQDGKAADLKKYRY